MLVCPNNFSELYQIKHTSSQGLGVSSGRILDTCLNFYYCCSTKNTQKTLKKSKICFFLPYPLFYDHQDHEIWHDLIYMKCTSLIPKFQEGMLTQKARKTFHSCKNGSQNLGPSSAPIKILSVKRPINM